MAFKFEIKDTHFLIVTDTSIVDPVEAMVLDMPKADAYYDHRLLKVRADLQKSEHVYIYDKNDTSTEGAKMFNEPLAECVDDNDVAFTKDSFITWMRTNTGFNLASGSGAIPWKYTATNYTDLTTVVAPTADEGDLAVVYNSQGVWPVNRRLRGIYIYLGGSWVYANQELQDILAAKLDSVVAGSNVSIDNTDVLNPIINSIDTTYTDLEIKTKYESNADTNAFTDSEKNNLSNQSGTNTGDETTGTIQTKRPLKTIEGQTLEGAGNIDLNKNDVGLENVDNTSDANKPISNATQIALDNKKDDFAENTAFNKNFGYNANEVFEGDNLNTAFLHYGNGTTNTTLTQNVWAFFEMSGAVLDPDTLRRFEQLALFPDTLTYIGLKNIDVMVISTFGLRRIGGGTNTYQMRMVKNGVQIGDIKQFELGGTDGSITMATMYNLDNGDNIWAEIRNITDNDNIRLLTASKAIK